MLSCNLPKALSRVYMGEDLVQEKAHGVVAASVWDSKCSQCFNRFLLDLESNA